MPATLSKWDEASFLLQKIIRPKLKTLSFCLVLVYFVYVEVVWRRENAWESTRELCLGQSSFTRCDNPSLKYSILDYAYHQNGNVYPICQGTLKKNDASICFDEKTFGVCMSQIDYIVSGPFDINSYFQSSNKSYFPLNIWIIILCSCCLVVSLLFETDSSFFVEQVQGSFSRIGDIAVARRLNLLISCAVVALMCGVLYTFILIRPETCSSERDHFCPALNACGGELESIIFPSDPFISSIRILVMFLVGLCSIGILIYTPTSALIEARNAEMNNNNNGEDVGSEGDSDYVQFMRANSANSSDFHSSIYSVRLGQQDVPRTVVDTVLDLYERQKVLNKWKIHRNLGSTRGCSECSICLNPLFLPARVKPQSSSKVWNRIIPWGSTKVAIINAENKYSTTDGVEEGTQASSTGLPASGDGPTTEEEFVQNTGLQIPREEGEEDRMRWLFKAFDKSDVVVEISCGHFFHRSCVLKWYVQNSEHPTCPVCRSDLQ